MIRVFVIFLLEILRETHIHPKYIDLDIANRLMIACRCREDTVSRQRYCIEAE